MDAITHLDATLFYLINGDLQTKFLDVLMPYVTRVSNWYGMIGLVWCVLMIWGGKKGRVLALLMIPAIAVSDYVNGHWVKEYFDRMRPWQALPDVRVLVGRARSGSFPSSHAVNIFTAATLVTWIYGRMLCIPCFLFAGMVAYSRVYVGMHYPLDAIGGAVLGVSLGTLFYGLWRWADHVWHARPGERPAPAAAH